MPLLIPSPKQITPSALSAVWMASLVSTVLLPLGVLFLLDVFVEVRSFQPEFGPYALAIGGALVIGSYLLAQRFRAEYIDNHTPPAANDEEALRAYAKKFFFGLGIAETPCYAAIFYYLMTTDVSWTLALCAASIFLITRYKPSWPPV